MNVLDVIRKNAPDAVTSQGFVEARIFSHPARTSTAQTLAGSGEPVFEGELLQLPLSWHPNGLKH